MTQAGDKTGVDRIAGCRKNDRNRRSRPLGSLRSSAGSGRKYDRDLTANQIGRQGRESFVVTLRPTKLDHDILALDVARLVQALAEGSNKWGLWCRRRTAEKTDHWAR